MSLDWTQVFGNFVSAAAGGGVAAFASWLAIGRQIRLQRDVQTRASIEFCEFVFAELAKTLRKVVDDKATKNMVMYADLDRLAVTYQLFERNRETLIHVPERQLRASMVDLLSEIQIWQIITRGALNNKNAAERQMYELGVSDEDKARAQQDANAQWQNVNDWFPDVMKFISGCAEVSEKLRLSSTRIR